MTNFASLDQRESVVRYINILISETTEKRNSQYEISLSLNISRNAGQPTSHNYYFADRQVSCSINSSLFKISISFKRDVFIFKSEFFFFLHEENIFLFCFFFFKLIRENASVTLQSVAFLWLLDQSIAWNKIAFGSLRR